MPQARRATALGATRTGGGQRRRAPCRAHRGGGVPQGAAAAARAVARDTAASGSDGRRAQARGWRWRRRVGAAPDIADHPERPLCRRRLARPRLAALPPADDEFGEQPGIARRAVGAAGLGAIPVHDRPAAPRQERHVHARALDGARDGVPVKFTLARTAHATWSAGLRSYVGWNRGYAKLEGAHSVIPSPERGQRNCERERKRAPETRPPQAGSHALSLCAPRDAVLSLCSRDQRVPADGPAERHNGQAERHDRRSPRHARAGF